jgi:hypothetical protein
LIQKAKKQRGISMKYSVREAVARAYVGWDFAQADRAIAWLDQCGYVIVSKATLQDEATTAQSSESRPVRLRAKL